MARRSSWLLALLALALLAAPLAVRAGHHGEDGDDDGEGGKGGKDDDVTEVKVKEDGTTFSLGSKWCVSGCAVLPCWGCWSGAAAQREREEETAPRRPSVCLSQKKANNPQPPPPPLKTPPQRQNNNRPITNGVLGCLEYDSEAEACVECLEPYFTLTEDGVCGAFYLQLSFSFGPSPSSAFFCVSSLCFVALLLGALCFLALLALLSLSSFAIGLSPPLPFLAWLQPPAPSPPRPREQKNL